MDLFPVIYDDMTCYYLPMAKNNIYSGAIVLGMHDALVSQTGIIAGLTFALADTKLIIMTGVISAVADGLSMMASNYLAERERGDTRTAIIAGTYTGIAYLGTSALLIIPFFITDYAKRAMGASFIIAVIIIFLFNLCTMRHNTRGLWHRFFEMLGICVGVSIIAFIIGEFAKSMLGV
ncbi:MAG: VIT1/CCC1 transporter family protein [Alphaproteobacteria bacterium]|nr:VIT1/CCC1 transporter family protein [Alphaproteobacteria bacterium]